ncbi:MAG TPA: hypothetical protein VG275_14125 [Solirubrobacteraceae bacterium]|nr:hypothetical protein [Solirubrobacteraceae bacterium]
MAVALNDRLAVVHLVRKANGQEPLLRFLDSYRAHPAGTDHELVLVLKGFESDADRASAMALAADLTDRSIGVEDGGFDLGSYLIAVRQLRCARYCFLNSFSRILTVDWLARLAAPLAEPGVVGLAGATGSWGSIGSYARFMIGLGGPYARVFSDRRATNQALASLEAARDPLAPARGRRQRYATSARALIDQWHGFPPLPAPHVRTTGMMVSHDVLERIRMATPQRKVDAYRLESGSASITAQVRALRLSTVVVGRDGRAYEDDRWPGSHTFWAGEQENLLIADKQTDTYERADAEMRAILAAFAWGQGAPPSK